MNESYAYDQYGRVRGWRRRRLKKNRVYSPSLAFRNPYPWMSSTEARVHLFLESIGVPFTWRYFDGEAPNFSELLPGFVPEFTLREYRTVILVIGIYYGQLPGVLDKNALAKSTLEFDGWTCAVLWEQDIVADTEKAVLTAVPALSAPAIKGTPRGNPSGVRPDYITRRAQALAAVKLWDKKFINPNAKEDIYDRNPRHRRRYRNRDRRSRVGNLTSSQAYKQRKQGPR